MAFPFLALLPAVENILDRILPNEGEKAQALLELEKLNQSGELARLVAETDIAKAQTEVNKIEAASSDKFATRWRPFIGWTCGFAFLYTLIIQPFMIFLCAIYQISLPDLPNTDNDLLGWALGGILGLGAMRTTERIKGVTK